MRKSTISSLPPCRVFPVGCVARRTQEAHGSPMGPDTANQPAEYAFWQELLLLSSLAVRSIRYRRSLHFRDAKPQGTSRNCRDGKPASIGLAPTSRPGMVRCSLTIWAKFQVPTPNVPAGDAPGGKSSSSTWIGLKQQRRYYQSTLPQFGTAQNIEPAAGGPTRSYFAWWQWWVRT